MRVGKFRISENVVYTARVDLHVLISLSPYDFGDSVENFVNYICMNTCLLLDIGDKSEIYVSHRQTVQAGVQQKVELQDLFLIDVIAQIDDVVLDHVAFNDNDVEELPWVQLA